MLRPLCLKSERSRITGKRVMKRKFAQSNCFKASIQIRDWRRTGCGNAAAFVESGVYKMDGGAVCVGICITVCQINNQAIRGKNSDKSDDSGRWRVGGIIHRSVMIGCARLGRVIGNTSRNDRTRQIVKPRRVAFLPASATRQQAACQKNGKCNSGKSQ